MKRMAVTLILGLLLAGCAGQATREDVDLEQVRREAALAYQERRYADAERHYRLLAGRLKTDAEPWFRLGNIYARSGRPEAAARAYHEAVVREPALSRAWYNLGVVRMRQAANAFVELTANGLPEDPLNARAERLATGLFDLLEGPSSGGAAAGAEHGAAGP